MEKRKRKREKKEVRCSKWLLGGISQVTPCVCKVLRTLTVTQSLTLRQ